MDLYDLACSYLVPLVQFLPLLGFFWAGCPCCGGVDCTVCSDDFNRANNTDIDTGSTCGWTETTGDSTIDTNTLKFTTSSDTATCDTNSPNASRSILVDVSGSAANNLARIIVGDHKVEIKFSTTAGSIKILNGADVQLAISPANLNIALSTMHSVTVCYDSLAGTLGASIPAISAASVGVASVSVSGLTNGLGTGGTVSGSVSFDNWELLDFNDDCLCQEELTTGCYWCLGDQGPHAWQVEINGTSNDDCDCALDGTYIVPFEDIDSTKCRWVLELPGTLTNCTPSFPGGPTTRDASIVVLVSGPDFLSLTNLVSVATNWGIGFLLWDELFTPDIDYDCLGATNYDLPYSGRSNNQCQGTGSTCAITAL